MVLRLLFSALRKRRFRLVAGLYLLALGPGWAQSLAMRAYTAANGLPESRVYCLSQDDHDRLWVGTQAGVCVYNGFEFKMYGGQAGLSDSHVRVVATAPGSPTVWLGLEYAGLAALGPDERIRAVRMPGLRMPARPTALWVAAGQLWLGTRSQGLWQLRYRPSHPDTLRQHWSTAQGLPTDTIETLGPGLRGRQWAATPQGLLVFDARSGRPLPAERAALPAILRKSVSCFGRVSDSVAWVGTAHELLRVSVGPAGWRLRRYAGQGLPPHRVLGVVQDAAGRVWVNYAAGLCRGTPEAQGLRWRYFARPVAIDQDHYQGVFTDCEDNLWAASADGLSQYQTEGRFVQFAAADGLPDNYVGAIARPRPGELWVGTRRGLWVLPLGPGGPRLPGHRLAVPTRTGQPAEIMSLWPDRRGGVWVGTFRDGARRYDLRTGQWTRYDQQVPGLRGRTVSSIAEDGRGRVWLLTHRQGVTVYDPATQRFTTYRRGERGLPSDDFWQAYRDRAGRLWLASDDAGLVRVDTERDTFRQLPELPAHFSLGSISEDQRGRLWLGPIGGQLMRYDPRSGQLRHYGAAAGLQSINPYFVQCDSAGQAWVGTHLGLDVLNISAAQAVSYGRTEGFNGGETNQNAVLLDADKRLWVGTVGGLMLYDPRHQPQASAPPPAYLTGLRVALHDTTLRPGLTLPYRLNSLAFEYMGVSLARPGSVRYQYRLRGLADEWVGPVKSTSATYASLPPGRYTFEVRASTGEGRWSAPAAFAFEINAPWWRRWWALLLYAATFGLALYGVRRRTRRQERERAERQLERQALGHLQELDRVKTDFFTNVSHELRTPLTLILGPAELLADTAPDATSRQRGRLVLGQARKLLGLLNQLLDLGKLDAGALRLHPAPGDVRQLARQLVASFESLAASRGVALGLEAPPGPVLLVFDAEKLDEILTNLLANALRFTPAGGRVTLRLAELPPAVAAPAGTVELIVADTGPGIEAEHLPHLFDRFYQASGGAGRAEETARQGTGIGLALVRELVALHGGTVAVRSTPGAGASFVVQLPRGVLVASELPAAAPLGPPQSAPPAERPSVASPAASSPAGGAVVPATSAGASGVPAPAPSPAGLPAAEVAPAAAESSAAWDTLGPPRASPLAEAEAAQLLIVEDSEEVRAFIAEALAGYHLLLAADGTAGLALARAEVPDLIISDVMMPGLSGYEVCAALKADAATSHIPVVLLTARSAADDRLLGLETGAQAYIPKPFRPRELQAQVRSLLHLSQQSRARFATLGPAASPPPAEVLVEAESELPAPAGVLRATLPNYLAAHQAAVAALPSLDQAFLQKLDAAVLAHLGDEAYGVDQLSEALSLSRTQLHRKLKALTGQAPGEYLRHTRLLRALALLQARVGTVAEVAYQVGYANPAHFSTAFSRQFGYPPSAVKVE